MKSKLTDEDIPDLADMLGEKLVKVVLVLFKVIFGLLSLDQAATLLEQTRLVFFFFYKTFMTKQFSSQRREMFVLVSHHCRRNLHYKPAILLFFLFFLSVSVQEVGVTKPTLFDLLPFKLAQMTVRFVKSLPEQYQVLLEYWEEKKKEKVEEEETEEEDETEGN